MFTGLPHLRPVAHPRPSQILSHKNCTERRRRLACARSKAKGLVLTEDGRDFAAWVGLVPRQFSTGGRTILGRISKRGNSYLRMLLVQAANVILMRPHRWDALGLGPWLRGVVGRMPHNKAAVALANKLARTAWSVLRHGSKYAVQRDEASLLSTNGVRVSRRKGLASGGRQYPNSSAQTALYQVVENQSINYGIGAYVRARRDNSHDK